MDLLLKTVKDRPSGITKEPIECVRQDSVTRSLRLTLRPCFFSSPDCSLHL